MIKAIQTYYKGYKFRSRTEARWAIFFDAMRVKWDYEIEGYELKSGRYLPDFLLHFKGMLGPVDAWVEIKGGYPSEDEIKKLHELSKETNKSAYFFTGVPGSHEIYECMAGCSIKFCMTKVKNSNMEKLLAFKRRDPNKFEMISPDLFALENAIDKSRCARFEFGETNE